MTQFFIDRHYPPQIVHNALTKAKSVCRSQALSDSPKTPSHRPIAVIPYHPHNLPAKNIILRNWHILQNDPALSDCFSEPPLIAYKKPQNIRDTLVRSKLCNKTTHKQSAPGTQPCGKPSCKTCPFLDKTTRIKARKQTFTVQRSFTCSSTNIVYVIRCTRCGMLYVGETKRTLQERVREHLDYISKHRDQPTGLHFNLPHHSLADFRVQVLWSVRGDTVDRKHWEALWIDRLGSKTPFGINRKE